MGTKKDTTLHMRLLNGMSNAASTASVLCAIKCTVFPLLIAVLPFIKAFVPGCSSCWLHQVSRTAALYFVGPVSSLAVGANWAQHERVEVGIWGFSGIVLILLANLRLPHAIFGVFRAH